MPNVSWVVLLGGDQRFPRMANVMGPQSLRSVGSLFAEFIEDLWGQRPRSTNEFQQMLSLAYLSLGSNLGDRDRYLGEAIRRLR